MAFDKLVDGTQLDSDLTSIANAIRTKSGGNGQLSFPNGFVNEIGNISTSGYSVADILNRVAPAGAITMSRNPYLYEFYNNTALTSVTFSGTGIGGHAFENCTALKTFVASQNTAMADNIFSGCTNLENADSHLGESSSYVFQNCKKLTTVNLPRLTSLGRNVFYGCTGLTTVTLSGCTTAGNDAWFSGCTALTSVTLSDSFNGQIKASAFANCSSLPIIDCKKASAINASAFSGATSLTKIILRKTGSITTLANVNAFNNTPFANGGTGGTIYVPSALISTYQTASNWSTVYGYGTITFTAIEGSPYAT